MKWFHYVHTFCIFVLLLLVSTANSAANLTEQSLDRLHVLPPVCEKSVDFVVCADPQPAAMLGTPKVFLDMIEEWNVLKPDLVICAGDMIMGGPPAEAELMWDEFLSALQKLQVPFFPVPGNHDVNDDPNVLRLYENRIAPFNYHISRGNALFIILNTEEPGDPDGFSQEQRNWLRTTLESSTAEHIFLFLHVPLFRGNWQRDWQPVADIIKGYPVRVVFAGHEHVYRDCGSVDGIRYVVAGSAGGGIGIPEEEGGFFCYLWVKVRGEEVSWAVVRPGSVLAANSITEEKVAARRSLRSMLSIEAISLPWGDPVDRKVQATISNPFEQPMPATLGWKESPGWQIKPVHFEVTVPPKSAVSLETYVRHGGPRYFPAPTLEGIGNHPETSEAVPLTQRLDIVPVAKIPHAPKNMTVDGVLAEWAAAPKFPLLYGANYDPMDTEDLEASVQILWDENHLYMAVEVKDDEFFQPYYGDIVWMADSVELWIENSNWSFSLTPKGPQVFLDERPDKHLDAVVENVPLAVLRQGNRVIYEAAYPAHELPQIRLEHRATIHFSLLVNDLDPALPERKRHYAELTPGAGEHFNCAKYRLVLQKHIENPE